MIDFKKVDHITLTYLPEKKAEARTFYTKVLMLSEIPGNHPNGAIWLSAADVEIHLVEAPQENHSPRHPAFELENLEAAKAHLQRHGVTITYSSKIQGRERFFIKDPFDNRIEFLAYD